MRQFFAQTKSSTPTHSLVLKSNFDENYVPIILSYDGCCPNFVNI